MSNEYIETIKTAVVGVGHLGQHHARILAGMPNVQLVCVVDADLERAKEIAERLNTTALAHWKEIPENVQAVSVVTPTSSHQEIACALLASGRDVMVEKPMSLTVEQGREMIETADKHQRILQVGHIERFNPAIVAIAEKLNKPLFIESHRLGPPTPRVQDVGVVLDLMIHDLDLVMGLVDSPIERVEAVGVPVLTDKEDIANARISFQSGCIANLTVSRISPESMRKIRIFQQDAYFSLNFMEKRTQIYRKVLDPNTQKQTIIREEADLTELLENDALTTELASFVKCVRTRTPPVVGGREGLIALEMALEITRLAQERLKRVNL